MQRIKQYRQLTLTSPKYKAKFGHYCAHVFTEPSSETDVSCDKICCTLVDEEVGKTDGQDSKLITGKAEK